MSKTEQAAVDRIAKLRTQVRAAMLAGDKQGCQRLAVKLVDAEDRLAKVEAAR